MKHCIHFLILLIGLGLAGSATAQQPRLLGILGGTQNGNLHTYDPVLSAFHRNKVKLYSKPNNDPKNPQAVIKEIPGSELYGENYLPNRKGVWVYGRENFGWYMVGAEERAWWIEVLPNIHFYDYLELLRQGDAYIKNWNWELYTEPGGAPLPITKQQVMKHHHKMPPVEVADTQEFRGETWIRVKLLDSACYELDRPSRVIATGWLPAYAENNDTTLWYRTQRCSR